jgi:hypothetical protein
MQRTCNSINCCFDIKHANNEPIETFPEKEVKIMRYQFVCYAMLSASKQVAFFFARMEVRLVVEVLTTLFYFVMLSSIQYDVSREVWMMTMYFS